MGWIQGTCDKCGTTDHPLVEYKKQLLCSVCARIEVRSEEAKKQIKSDEREKKLWDERTTPVD